jgi:hypothetical protein
MSSNSASVITGATDNFGYQSVGMESLDPDRPPDLKEALTVRNPSARRGAHWPSAGLRDLILDFYQRCLVVAHKLQGDTATLLDVPRDYFHSRITGENVTLRLLHYPPLDRPGVRATWCRRAYGLRAANPPVSGPGRWFGGLGAAKRHLDTCGAPCR